MPFSRDLAHRVAGSLAMAGIGCWAAWEGRTLGLFVLGTPAPGLFPFIFGCMLLVMALLCLIVDIAAMRGGGAAPAVQTDDRSGLTRCWLRDSDAVGRLRACCVRWPVAADARFRTYALESIATHDRGCDCCSVCIVRAPARCTASGNAVIGLLWNCSTHSPLVSRPH